MFWLIVGGIWMTAYLLGSIPTGYIIAKLLRGIDIREHGSGNTGATNVFRVVGKTAGSLVLLIDILKGASAVLIAQQVAQVATLSGSAWLMTGSGLLAILGHSKSVWLGFSGGKSAATGLGILLALAWPVGLATATVFAIILAGSRFVSLSSIAAAIAAPLLMLLTSQPLPFTLLAAAGGIYVIIRHRSNINRLLSGTEPKIGTPTA
ncbi:MAG: glycerol-3-phosphate 1-O-acyltransferase PlsY [Leptolyngbya sp. SIO4C1]|nr:glycerol-3-phosphate 1-O-acyltransferase PlsY [Leptolyngbya sp. SIO4C1]